MGTATLFALLVGAAALGSFLAWLARQLTDRVRGTDAPAVRALLDTSERRFAAILSIAADAIITVDHTQRILHFNQGAEEIFGYAESDAIGRHLSILIPHRFRDVHSEHIQGFARSPDRSRRMGGRRELFGLRADGTEFPAEASISKLVGPDGILFTVVLRDITWQRRAEAEQRFLAQATSALSRTLAVDETVGAIADLPVPLLADACLVVTREPRGALRRRPSSNHAPELASGVARLTAHALTDDSPWPSIDVMRRNRRLIVDHVDDAWLEQYTDGNEIADWRDLGARSLLIVPLHASGESLGALTLIRVRAEPFDREARELAETFAATAATALANARLYESARAANRAREELLSVVSHDLRNPLTAIGMCVHALELEQGGDPGERRELLATIRTSSSMMNRMIEDLLDVASIERGSLSMELTPQDPAELVRRALQLFTVEAAESGVRIESRAGLELPNIEADAGRIVQVLGNLIRNSIKFTPPAGSIAVSVEAQGAEVVFAVRDTGRGISPEQLPHVFDRYWQADDDSRMRGRGLGLSIARGIVEAHGGRIWASSQPGRGTEVRFSIPVAGRSAAPGGS